MQSCIIFMSAFNGNATSRRMLGATLFNKGKPTRSSMGALTHNQRKHAFYDHVRNSIKNNGQGHETTSQDDPDAAKVLELTTYPRYHTWDATPKVPETVCYFHLASIPRTPHAIAPLPNVLTPPGGPFDTP